MSHWQHNVIDDFKQNIGLGVWMELDTLFCSFIFVRLFYFVHFYFSVFVNFNVVGL